MSGTRLTLNLPDDVWRRLQEEAAAQDKTIGAHVRDLIVARDTKRRARDK